MGRRKVVVRVNKEREAALSLLKYLFALQHDDEVYDLALDQLYEATLKLEQRVKEEKTNDGASEAEKAKHVEGVEAAVPSGDT